MATLPILYRITDETGYQTIGRNWRYVDPFHAWRFMPADLPGVYAFSFGPRLIYVGQSRDLRTRLRTHGLYSARDDFGLYVYTPWGIMRSSPANNVTLRIRVSKRSGDWLMHERRIIARTRPQFNRSIP